MPKFQSRVPKKPLARPFFQLENSGVRLSGLTLFDVGYGWMGCRDEGGMMTRLIQMKMEDGRNRNKNRTREIQK